MGRFLALPNPPPPEDVTWMLLILAAIGESELKLQSEVMTAITIFFVLEMSLRMLVLGPARRRSTVYAVRKHGNEQQHSPFLPVLGQQCQQAAIALAALMACCSVASSFELANYP